MTIQSETPTTKEWAIVEIMGHQTIAGEVSEFQFAGAAFVRVDVPKTSKTAAFTQMINPQSVYRFTPVDESIARAASEKIEAKPVQTYYVSDLLDDVKKEVSERYESRIKQLRHGSRDPDYDDDDGIPI